MIKFIVIIKTRLETSLGQQVQWWPLFIYFSTLLSDPCSLQGYLGLIMLTMLHF